MDDMLLQMCSTANVSFNFGLLVYTRMQYSARLDVSNSELLDHTDFGLGSKDAHVAKRS